MNSSTNETAKSDSMRSTDALLVRGDETGGALHGSFREQGDQAPAVALLAPSVADLSARRCISDSVLRPGVSNNTQTYNNQNTIFMMVSRSGGQTVKIMLQKIRAACEAHEVAPPTTAATTTEASSSSSSSPLQPVPPEREIHILAQWAVDAYYNVVISANGGIPLIVRAMTLFPTHRGIQECCCLALGNLCSTAGSKNLKAADDVGAIGKIIQAMKTFPRSVAIQCAACDALRNMCGLVIVSTGNASMQQQQGHVGDLIQVLSRAKEMHLLPKHRRLAADLLEIVSTNCPTGGAA